MIELLPEVLLVRKADRRRTSLPMLLELMAEEVTEQRIGAATIMARLADIVMTQIVRAWVESQPAGLSGWLAAIKDPQIGAALVKIHREPGKSWTVETLATEAGVSRSVFSERFTSLLSVSPGRYLLQWRMRLAAVWLKNEHMTVAETAQKLGYESDAGFSRAFKRFFGVAPSSLRPKTTSL